MDATGVTVGNRPAAGHDAAGHDAAGHATAGHDAAGHDAAGHDAAGHDAAGRDAAVPNARVLVDVTTFNIRRPAPKPPGSPDRWSVRAPALAALLHAHRGDVLALQEVVPGPVADLVRDAAGDRRALISTGAGRDGGGEQLVVAVDPQRHAIRRVHRLSLSRWPAARGVRGWGALLPRQCLVVELRTAGRIDWTVLATHLDPFSARSRRRSLALLGAVARTRREPVVLLGDLNDPLRRTPAPVPFTALRPADGVGTYHRYRSMTGAPQLDHVLIGPGVRALECRAVADRPGGHWPSDHAPLTARLELDTGFS